MPSIDIIEALIRMTVIRLRSGNAVECEQTAVVASDKPNAAEPEPEQDLLTDYYILKPLAPDKRSGRGAVIVFRMDEDENGNGMIRSEEDAERESAAFAEYLETAGKSNE